jgi:CheY-like chemotaxis protein
MTRTLAPARRLLIIDDHAPFLQTLACLLRVAGHTVYEAGEGSAGLALLRQKLLDLVVTDQDMPGLTGWDVARLVKATHPRIPVVLVAGGTDGETVLRSRREHADAILRKPFPIRELLVLVARLTADAGTRAGSGGARYFVRAGQGITSRPEVEHGADLSGGRRRSSRPGPGVPAA